MTAPGYLATPGREAQIRALLAWIAKLNAAASMPWAEPPGQPDLFDQRDAAEAEKFAEIMTARNRGDQ